MESAMSFLQMPLNRQERRRRLQRQGPDVSRPEKDAPMPEADRSTAVVLPAPPLTIEQEAMLELLGQPPVTYHRLLVDVCGSLTAAIWCSLAIRLTKEQSAEDLSFELSADECELRTGMTRREQETARTKLRKLGLLEQKRRRHGMAYRMDLNALDHRIRLCILSQREAQPATGTHN
jgi:hypothetical protein